jgi:hypothetical protein
MSRSTKRPPIVGAYPDDHEGEWSDDDASDTSSEPIVPTKEPDSPTKQRNRQQDEDMDALSNALQSSLPVPPRAPNTGYSINETVQQALEVLERQRQQDALQSSSQSPEPEPDRTVARILEGYSAPSPSDSFSESSSSSETSSHNGSNFYCKLGAGPSPFGNLTASQSLPNLVGELTNPDDTSSHSGDKVPADGLIDRSADSSPDLPYCRPAGWNEPSRTYEQYTEASPPISTFGYEVSKASIFPCTGNPIASPLPELRWSVQASAGQVNSTSTTEPQKAAPVPPKPLVDKSPPGGLFNPSGKTSGGFGYSDPLLTKPSRFATPFPRKFVPRELPHKSLFDKYPTGSFLTTSGKTSAQPLESSSPSFNFGNGAPLFGDRLGTGTSNGGFNFFAWPEMTAAQPVQSTSPFPQSSGFGNGSYSTSFGDIRYSVDEFRKFHAQSISRVNWNNTSNTSEPYFGFWPRADFLSDSGSPEASSSGNVGNEPQGASSKRQSEHLDTPEDPTTDDSTPAKRLFRQARINYVCLKGEKSLESGLDVQSKMTDSHGTFRIRSSEEFVMAALPNLQVHGTIRNVISESLTNLYGFMMSFPDDLASNTKIIHDCNTTISDIDTKMLSLRIARETVFGGFLKGGKELHELLKPLKEQKRLSQSLLESKDLWVSDQRHNLVAQILRSLEFIFKHSKLPNNADSDPGSCEPGGRKVVDVDAVDESTARVNELRVQLDDLKQEIKDREEESKVELVKNINSMQQKAAARYRNDLNEKLAKCALDKDTALRQLKEQYAARISDAETKSRLHKKATAQIEELEATVRRLEREKSELMSAKATVEKQLEERETQAKGLQGYQEAYNQVVEERDQLQSEYYDVVAERDELRQAQGTPGDASDQQNIPASGQTTSILQTGTLQSYDSDLDLLENYRTRQENFAEMAMRETAAEIRDVEAQIEEAGRQLRLLDAPDNGSDVETDATDPESETEVEPEPSAEISQPQLLDTLTQPLRTSNQAQPPQSAARVAIAGPSQPTTWASKAANAKDIDKGRGRGYVHAFYHGHGVSTMRRIDSSDMQK